MCLDQPNKQFYSSSSLAEQILFGGKDMLNIGNRWYDKTIQFIIGIDGVLGLNFEHSPAEAIVLIHLMEYTFQSMYVTLHI